MPLEARMLAGSVGKMFVAGVVLDLVGRGDLDLDAPISDWLGDEPWFSHLPNGPDLTLRLLMNHVSGVPDHLALDAYMDEARALTAPGGEEMEGWSEYHRTLGRYLFQPMRTPKLSPPAEPRRVKKPAPKSEDSPLLKAMGFPSTSSNQ